MSVATPDTSAPAGGRFKWLRGTELFGRFGYLLATQVVLLANGVGYWMLTTHGIVAGQVGVAAAAISTAALLGGLGTLGIGPLLLVELGHQPRAIARVLTSTSAIISGAAVALLALLVIAVSGVLGASLHELGRNETDACLFVVGAMLNAVGAMTDAAAIGLRQAPAQFIRNLLQSLVRLGLTAMAIALDWRSATALLAAWTISIALSILPARRLLKLKSDERSPTPFAERVGLVRRFGPLALRHYVLSLAITSVTYFLPVIAALEVQPRDYAYFSVAQLVASSVLLPPALLAMALFAETTGDEAALRHHIRRTLPVGFALASGAVVCFGIGAHLVLGLFGAAYAAHGAPILRLLLIGGLPYVVKDHYVSIRRAQQRLTEAAKVVACATVLEVIGAACGGALDGIIGLCAGWAVATTIETLCFAPAVRRIVRRSDPTSALAPEVEG